MTSGAVASASAAGEPVLETLFERDGVTAYDLPDELRARYGGAIGFDAPVLYANFVTTLDGVVALAPDVPPSVISGRSAADRFVMGLLRACAGSVVVGAGTLRAEPSHLWTPDRIFPAAADVFARLRQDLGLEPTPRLFLVTRSGEIDPGAPALELGATIVTTEAGASRVRGRVPAASSVVAVPGADVGGRELVRLVRADGHRVVLTEGGPTLFGELLRDGLVDELFQTLSPRLSGRTRGSSRLGLVEGHAFAPHALQRAELLSAKRHGSHLFLRYRLERAASGDATQTEP